MSIAERRNDPCGFLLIVYDHHQPSARSDVPLKETLAMRPAVGFSMIGQPHSVQYVLQMRLKLYMATVRIQDVQQPRVLEQNHPGTFLRLRLSKD